MGNTLSDQTELEKINSKNGILDFMNNHQRHINKILKSPIFW